MGEIERVHKLLNTLKINKFEYYFLKGLIEDFAGNKKEAIKNYKISVKLKPNFLFPHFYLGNIYENERNYIKAFEEYMTALENFDEHSEYFYLFSNEDVKFLKNFLKQRVGEHSENLYRKRNF